MRQFNLNAALIQEGMDVDLWSKGVKATEGAIHLPLSVKTTNLRTTNYSEILYFTSVTTLLK